MVKRPTTTPGQRLALNAQDRQLLAKFLRRSKANGTVAVFAFSIDVTGQPEYFMRGDSQLVGQALQLVAQGLVDRGLGSSGLAKRPWLRRALEWLRGALRLGGK